MTTYFDPIFSRLEPRTPFQGGRITDTDVLNLGEAARFASVHAGTEITPADFLRAAGRGEITLRAIVHQTAKLQKIGGGVYCNAGQSNENTVPMRSILNLPLSACQQLAATGRASWRKFDGFEQIDGVLMRYAIAELMSDESDFETTTDDCRVTGNAVNALADAFIEAPAQTATPAPVVAGNEPVKQVNAMKKAALIAALEYEWPSIEDNISEATRNGLKAAAHTGKHGEWDKDKARAWAVSNGKIKQSAPVHSLAGAWLGTTTRHTITG